MQKTTTPGTTLDVRSRSTFTIFALLTLAGCVIFSLLGYFDAVVLGIVQGLGEFLPISSSAHLILVPWLFGWEDHGLAFDVALHLGTLVAVVAYFWRDWISLLSAVPGLAKWGVSGTRGGLRSLKPNERLLLFVILATIPGGVLGLLLKDTVESAFRAPLLIAVTLPILGVLLYVADRFQPQRREIEDLTWRDALLVGIAQGCALIPGISRSGATMTTGRFLQLDRSAAARFSFLLSAPITGAAVLASASDILAITPGEVGSFVVGAIVSGAVGAIAIHFLLDYIRRAGFGIFAIYRVALAVVIVIVWLARG